jgi:NAD(P)-dependent dehydrogenase (short-subunit alcohol dehydrogenase family)
LLEMQKAIIFAPANLLEDAMDLHLRGKSVLITGASKGIGAATAEAFAEEGSNVHLAARSTEAMRALAERLRALIKSTSLRILSICANRTIFIGWRAKPPASTSLSTMPATFPEARLRKSMRRHGVTPGS